MRISDWSSDVCSSDLWVGTRFLASPEASLHERAREAVLTMAVTDTAVTRAFSGKPMRVLHNRYVSDFESAGVQRGFPLQLLEEIGRASCRERVCQYV